MVGILKYGVGNIFSLSNIYNEKKIPHKFISSENDFEGVTHVILPGVGSFDYAMEMLDNSGLKDPLVELVKSKKIFLLGICVGFQMLFQNSEEGHIKGLSLIKADIKKINKEIEIIPHMGWNNVEYDSDLSDGLFENIIKSSKFYFLHSYYLPFSNDLNNHSKALTYYGENFISMIVSENIVGVQFHPEKSHIQGVNFLINFSNLK